MLWRNSVGRYGAVHKTLHWVIAILVLMMLVMGWKMGSIPNGPDKFWVYSLHKSLGITILFLMLARLGWKLANWDLPRPLPTHQRWEQKLAAFVHWLFYGLLIVQPLSGWMLTGAANSTINWFGFFPVPNIVAPNPELKYSMAEAHDVISTLIWICIGLHVAGALKHVIIDKDGTLRRMVPFGALILALLPTLAFGAEKVPPTWTIDRTKSTLSFEGTQENSPFKGQFKAFDGKIILDPEHPQSGSGLITIDLASIDSQNEERDSTVKGTDWFDTATTPTATYKISKFEKSGKEDGQLLATGALTLRGLEKPLDLPFSITVTEKDGVKSAHVVGETTLKRLDFGVGGGQWTDTAMVGNAFLIHVDVTLVAAKP